MKKFISIVLACMLVCAFGCLSVSASGETITVDSVEAESGTTVDLWVRSSSVIDEFGSIDLQIAYNASDLELTKAATVANATGYNEDAEEEFTPVVTKSKNKTVNPYVVQWRSDYGSAWFETTNLIKLSFKVLATDPGTYPVSVSYYVGNKGNYVDGVNVNYTFDEQPLNFSYVAGGITIPNNEPQVNTITVNSKGKTATFETADAISGTVLVAVYNGNRVVAVGTYDAAAEVNADFAYDGAYTKIKAMWWTKLTDLTPNAPAQELK